jgi:hypothetical protein
MRHLYSFRGNETVEQLKEQVARVGQGATAMCRTVEVVITSSQITRAKRYHGNDLVANLIEAGFQHSFSFRNANSGNVCHVFHYVKFHSRPPVGLAKAKKALEKKLSEKVSANEIPVLL